MVKINEEMVKADLRKILHLINPARVAEEVLLKLAQVREEFSAYAVRLTAKDTYAVEDVIARYAKFYYEKKYDISHVGYSYALELMKKKISKHRGAGFEQLYQDVIWGRLSLRDLVDSIHNANVEAELDEYLDSVIDRFVPSGNVFYHEALVAEYLQRHKDMLSEETKSLPPYQIGYKDLLKMHYKMVDRIQKRLTTDTGNNAEQ
ncbi:MAG: hypothetical protein ABIG11_07910 [bacterium]